MKRVRGSISIEAILSFTIFMILCLTLTGTLLSVYLSEVLSWDLMNTRESMAVIAQPFMDHDQTVQKEVNALALRQIAMAEINRRMEQSGISSFMKVISKTHLRFNAFGISDFIVAYQYKVPTLFMKSEIVVPINALLIYDGINFNVPIVYITNYGEKFHKGDCFHLRKSKFAIPIEEAKEKGYEACKNCHTDAPSEK